VRDCAIQILVLAFLRGRTAGVPPLGAVGTIEVDPAMDSIPDHETASAAGAARRTPPRSRWRSWGRRFVFALLVLVVFVTLAALVFDLATNGREQPASALYRGPFVRVDQTTLAYRSWGRHGSPVVLLGGAAEPSWVWHDVGPLIARAGRRVFALDLPPFGYSQRRGPYTMTHWLQLVQGFERRLHIVHPVLVGHSLGAGVATAAGLAHPRQVAGVVLLDGDALPFGGSHAWLSYLLVYPYYSAVYRLVTGSDWIVGRVLRSAWGPKPVPTGHATLAQFERPFRVQGTDSALRQLLAGGIPGVSLRRLAGLHVPRAVIWGTKDNVDSLASGRSTAAALHTRFQTVPEAGHLTMLAAPRATAERILRFIASLALVKRTS
jgi:pimeloyl-ACP methyl ester carboxylesterase